MDETKNTPPAPKTLIDVARPHFTHKDFNPDRPEAVLTLYMGALRLVFGKVAPYSVNFSGTSGDYKDDPALFSVSMGMTPDSPLTKLPEKDEKILCSCDWQIHNIDSAAATGTLDLTEILTYRIAGEQSIQGKRKIAGFELVHESQQVNRTPHQLGATFYNAAVFFLSKDERTKLRRYMARCGIAEPTLDLVH